MNIQPDFFRETYDEDDLKAHGNSMWRWGMGTGFCLGSVVGLFLTFVLFLPRTTAAILKYIGAYIGF